MKKIISLFLIISFNNINSQEINVVTGINFTTYDYTFSSPEGNSNLNGSTGSYFELNYSDVPFNRIRNLQYLIGITLNQFNATGGDLINNYSWNTNYLGVISGAKYTITDYRSLVQIKFKGGINFNKIINGQQKINGQTYDLTKQEDFSVLGVQPFLGAEVGYEINNQMTLNVGYNLSKNLTYRIPLNFSNSRIEFGVTIKIN